MKEMQLVRVTRVVGWLKVGTSIFMTGGVLQLVLAAVALAKIESPTSHMWATLSILAWLLLITGSLIIYSVRARQREDRISMHTHKINVIDSVKEWPCRLMFLHISYDMAVI